MKTIRIFLCSAGILLLVTAAAKLISSVGSAGILQKSDPILIMSYRHRAMHVTPPTATACDARANRVEPAKLEPPAVPNGRTVFPARPTCAG